MAALSSASETLRPSSRPGSSGTIGSRPGSSSQRKSASLTRLTDEAPLAQARPSTGSQQHAGTARLLDDPLSGGGRSPSRGSNSGSKEAPSSRPGSGSASRASLSRLPAEDAILLPSRPISQGDKPSETGSKLFRQRMGKSLAIATGTRPEAKPAATVPQQVFRTLTESEKIEDFYNFGEQIYCAGTKGKVLMATRLKDSVEVVVKIRSKHAGRSTSERNWRAIMNQLTSVGGSSHVLEIIEILETPTEFYIVMPKCDGGELFEFLATETEVPEAECKRIIREILTAVGHLHKNNLIHRDIKPENIMFKMETIPGDPQGGSPIASPKTVKLIDFDTCLEWTPATPKNRRFVGTPGYIAPEALLGQLSPQSDLWSIGVILYILMTGEMPWTSMVSIEDGIVGSTGARKMYNMMKEEVLDWDSEPWSTFTLAADLCKKLLAFELEDRIGTVEEALAHDWLMVE